MHVGTSEGVHQILSNFQPSNVEKYLEGGEDRAENGDFLLHGLCIQLGLPSNEANEEIAVGRDCHNLGIDQGNLDPVINEEHCEA